MSLTIVKTMLFQTVLQPKGDIFDNLECRYAEYFMFDYDYMGLKADKNRWAQIGALGRFHQP